MFFADLPRSELIAEMYNVLCVEHGPTELHV